MPFNRVCMHGTKDTTLVGQLCWGGEKNGLILANRGAIDM